MSIGRRMTSPRQGSPSPAARRPDTRRRRATIGAKAIGPPEMPLEPTPSYPLTFAPMPWPQAITGRPGSKVSPAPSFPLTLAPISGPGLRFIALISGLFMSTLAVVGAVSSLDAPGGRYVICVPSDSLITHPPSASSGLFCRAYVGQRLRGRCIFEPLKRDHPKLPLRVGCRDFRRLPAVLPSARSRRRAIPMTWLVRFPLGVALRVVREEGVADRAR